MIDARLEAHRVAIENQTGMVGEAGSRLRADARYNPLDGSSNTPGILPPRASLGTVAALA